MPVTINASPSNGLVQTADGSGILKVQSNGVTTNALAWVNFNGTTSPGTIRSQYNVSSVTKNGTGDYTLNFTTALSDANYAITLTNGYTTLSATNTITGVAQAPTTTAARIITVTGGTSIQVDTAYVFAAIFGN